MEAGTLDMATIETPITTVDPVLGATALPYIFTGRDHIAATFDGPAGAWIEDRLAAEGLRVLAFMEGGFRQITNNVRPIVVPADLEGVKMRTPSSKLRIKIFGTYGANASPLPFAELYPALQTGVFDGQENPVVNIVASNLAEVQDYISLSAHQQSSNLVVMNEDKWQSLSEEQQAALQAAVDEAMDQVPACDAEATEAQLNEWRENGPMQVIDDVDREAFRAKAEPYLREQWSPEQVEVLDAIRSVAE